MSKYIDADKLIAEIERLKNQNERRLDNIVPIRRKDTMDEEQLTKIELRDKVDKAYLNGVLITLSDILSFITSLQQELQDVDLEKEAKRWWKEHLHLNPENQLWMDAHQSVVFARYFFELGRARKEE
jgi:folate-dependent tRNA-U54 methylase TrmFO/GidA